MPPDMIPVISKYHGDATAGVAWGVYSTLTSWIWGLLHSREVKGKEAWPLPHKILDRPLTKSKNSGINGRFGSRQASHVSELFSY